MKKNLFSPYYRHTNFVRKLTVAVALLTAVSCGTAFSQTQPTPPPKPLHFMVFGDWGTGNAQQKAVAEAMAHYAETSKTHNPVQFVISTGDNFYEDGVSSVDDPQWETKFEKMYDKKRLPMPFISVLGNHDWKLEPGAQLAYSGANPGTRWQIDGFWFKRSYPKEAERPLVDFFYIDTNIWNYQVRLLQDQQLTWLTKALQTSQAQWQIVVGHHPLYSDGDHGRDKELLALRDKLGPLFKRWGVDAYLSGHDHDLQRIEVPGEPTLFLISGAAGKLRPRHTNDWKPFYASTAGFAALTVSATQLSGKFLDTSGNTLDSWQRKPVPPQQDAGTATAGRKPIAIDKLNDLIATLATKITAQGLELPSDSDGIHQATTVAGIPARQLETQYLYVDVNDPAYHGPLDLWVTVDVATAPDVTPTLHYDKAEASPTRQSRYTRVSGEWKTLDKNWKRGVFFLPQARLESGQNHNADFRLSGKGAIVQRIQVSPRATSVTR